MSEYTKLLGSGQPCPPCDDDPNRFADVTHVAQRAWLTYRNAWTTLYSSRWKNVASAVALQRECETALAAERIKALQTIREELFQ